MYVISKDFAFSASHQLRGLPAEHQCARLHGHNYVVRVQITCPTTDAVGFVVDFGLLKPVGHYIDTSWDHRHLNDVLDFNPTAEHMARHIAELVPRLLKLPAKAEVAVGVSETPKTWSWWRP